MLETTVLVAEAAVALWFVLFAALLVSMARESRHMRAPKPDAGGRALILNARAAFAVGIVALAVLAGVDFGLL